MLDRTSDVTSRAIDRLAHASPKLEQAAKNSNLVLATLLTWCFICSSLSEQTPRSRATELGALQCVCSGNNVAITIVDYRGSNSLSGSPPRSIAPTRSEAPLFLATPVKRPPVEMPYAVKSSPPPGQTPPHPMTIVQ